MDIFEYAEKVSAKTLDVAMKTYDDLHDRAHRFATLTVAGGGAVGAYVLGKIGVGQPLVSWLPLAVLAIGWLAAAAHVVVRGATSNVVSPGNGPNNIRSYYADRLQEANRTPEEALQITREAELDVAQKRLTAYLDACKARALAIDRGYRAASVYVPVLTLVIAGLCFRFG